MYAIIKSILSTSPYITKPDTFRAKKIEFKKYWSRRWEWAPTGSVHSQYEHDMINKPSIME